MHPDFAVVCALVAATAFVQQDTWSRLTMQADGQELLGNYQQAADFYGRAAAVKPSNNSQLLKSLAGLATAYDELGKYQEAGHKFEQALALADRSFGEDSLQHAATAVCMSTHYAETNERARAEKLVRQAIPIFVSLLPPDDPRLSQARSSLAVLLMEAGRLDEAETLLDQAFDAERHHRNLPAGRAAVTLSNLGVLRGYQRRYEESEEFFRQSVANLESELGTNHPLLFRALNNLAMVDMALDRRQAAEAAFERAIAIGEKHALTSNPIYARVLLNYAALERKIGNRKKARATEARARAILAESNRDNGIGMTIDASAFQARR